MYLHAFGSSTFIVPGVPREAIARLIVVLCRLKLRTLAAKIGR